MARRTAPPAIAASLVGLALAVSCAPAAAQTPAPTQVPAQVPAKSSDQIFQDVFGKRAKGAAQAPRDMNVPVIVDGREAGTVPVKVPPDPGQTTVELSALLDVLRPAVQPDLVDRLRTVPAEGGSVAVSRLSAPGMTLSYEPSEVAVVVRLDPAARKPVELDLGGTFRLPTGNAVIEPASVSAFTNFTLNEEWIGLSDQRAGAGRSPLRGSMAHAVNLFGVVAEGSTLYREDGLDRWQRGDLRLTKDWVDARVRSTAGDLVFPSTGFQSSRAIAGLLIDRNFLLQPYRPYQPTGNEQFVLTAPATVDVMVNGRPTRTYRLPAGPYNLRNFPGTLGTNDVTIRMTDEFGRVSTVTVPFFFDNQLLGEGVHEFSYAAGLPSTVDRGVYRYDRARPTVSARHRVGITDQLTIGLNAQGDPDQRMAGGEVLFTSILGTIGVEPAVSEGYGIRRDHAVRVSYRDFAVSSEVWNQRTVTASATWRGPDFAPLGTVTPSNPVRLDLAARVSQPLTPRLTASLGGRYQLSRDPTQENALNVELGVRTRLTDYATFDVSVERNHRPSGDRETAVFANLRFLFDDYRQTAGISANTRDRRTQLDWRYRSLDTVDALDAGVQVGRDRDGRSAEGDATYVHQRFIASARSNYLSQLSDGSGSTGARTYDRRTALSLSTGLAFADGRVGVTRPISDSFAIVAPHPRLAGRRIGVDPYNERYTAQSDLLGPPVLPDLSAYRQRALLLDVADVPVTYDLGNDRPVIMPTYRSGAVVPIGTDATASLSGVLKDAAGKPFGLQSGVLRPADGSGGAEIQFFSNRQGRFRVEGVRPGTWQLVVYGEEGKARTLVVPADAETLDIGEVKL